MFVFRVFMLLMLSSLHFNSVHGQTNSCKSLHFAEVAWSDVAASTAVARFILENHGIKTRSTVLSVPVTFASLANQDVDLFLGNWMPSMRQDIAPYLQAQKLEVLGPLLEGARYTLAVNEEAYRAGVRHFADLAAMGKHFDHQILGIEAGNDGNRLIKQMLKEQAFALNTWSLIESSEQAMIREVDRRIQAQRWSVFLAWEPHPMNQKLRPHYLEGGDAYFGLNQGRSNVFAVARKGFASQCPEVAKFIKSLRFDVAQMNQLMELMLEQGKSPQEAAKQWLGENQKFIYSLSKPPHAMPPPSYDARGGNLFFPTSLRMALEFFAILVLVHLLRRQWRFSLLTAIGLGVIASLGLWEESKETLLLVALSSTLSAVLGFPIGVVAAHHPRFASFLSPFLDAMQTMPTFVYLIPALVLFGLGLQPALFATVVFILPTMIRMVCLGIKSLPQELRDLGAAYGATSWQILRKVELPWARETIVEGFAQSLSLALSMVVISALVGAQGLGRPVVEALNTVQMGLALKAGSAIVIISLLCDRLLKHRTPPERVYEPQPDAKT